MRTHLIRTSATLALALATLIVAAAFAACGGSSSSATASPAGTCINASASHHAYVVVQHLSGTAIQKCVGFTTDTIDGQALMDQSMIQFATQTFSFGKAACQIDNEPAQFTKCTAPSQPYWSLWVETATKWDYAQTAYTDVKLHDKEAIGWRYVQPTDPSPSPPPLAKP